MSVLSTIRNRRRRSTLRLNVYSPGRCGIGCLLPSALSPSRRSLALASQIGGCRARILLGTARRKGFDSLTILGSQCLWKERNRRVFDGVGRSPQWKRRFGGLKPGTATQLRSGRPVTAPDLRQPYCRKMCCHVISSQPQPYRFSFPVAWLTPFGRSVPLASQDNRSSPL